jgi:hypothetical protein
MVWERGHEGCTRNAVPSAAPRRPAPRLARAALQLDRGAGRIRRDALIQKAAAWQAAFRMHEEISMFLAGGVPAA